MKERILTLLFSVIIVIVPAYGQLSKNIVVSTPGTLENQLGADKTKVTDLVLTGTINDVDFTTIKQMSSLKNLDMKNLNIVNGIIPSSAFANRNMTTLILPTALKVVGASAFSRMSVSSLDFSLCQSLEEIGSQSFNGVVLTNKVLDFSKCDQLVRLPYDGFRQGAFTGYSGHVILPDNMKQTPAYSFNGFLGSVDLPHSLESIGWATFINSKLKGSIVLPATLKNIQEEAFSSMEATEINFQNCLQLEEIKAKAFSGLKLTTGILNLSKCSLLSRLPYDGYRQGIFTGYSGHVILPDNMKQIPAYSFNGFLGSVDLPHSLESIGWAAFINSKLKGVIVLPTTLKDIQEEAFSSMEATELNFQNCLQLEEIKAKAFSGLKLTNGTLDFSKCSLLNRLPYNGLHLGAFSGYSGHVILPSNMITITANTFSSFRGSITFPPVLEIIGESAFANSVFTKGIVFPNSLKTIGKSAFYNSTIPSVSFEQMDPGQSGVSCF